METNLEQNKQAKYEEEHVLLDLDGACLPAEIPPNAPYVLSALDTMNPVLVIGDHLMLVQVVSSLRVDSGKSTLRTSCLIGEYQETMGTCYLFSEIDEETVVLHPETGPSERNHFKEKSIVDSNSDPSKKVQPITGLQKVLKFRRVTEDEMKTATSVPATSL